MSQTYNDCDYYCNMPTDNATLREFLAVGTKHVGAKHGHFTMSANDALDLFAHIFFVALGAIALVDFVRHRDVIRRDVALLFGLLAIPFLIQLIARINGQEVSKSANDIAILALLFEPYLVLRLVRYLRSMPVYMMRLAVYGMIATVIAGIVFGPRVPAIPAVISPLYFGGLNLYAMVGFVRGALKTTGVARQRLRFAAAGSGLFGLIFVAVLLASAFPLQKEVALLLVEVLVIACGAAFYIGFAPPRSLRRTWQLVEAGNYLAALSGKSLNERLNIAEIMTDLCRVANRGVGGMTAGIARKGIANQEWVLTYTDELVPISLDNAEILARAWDSNMATSLRASDRLGDGDRHLMTTVGADTLLVTPIVTAEGTWGIFLVFLKYSSLFVEDDLHFVTLLVKQNAILLENSTLVARLQNNSVQLATANRELEAFSYSVSHDLRAPLRALSGFSQALEDDYNDRLDAEGKDYLQRIRAASQRMGQLIDDLLQLSRLSRTELRRTEVDLSDLARQIGLELREKYLEHPSAFRVEEGLLVNGDARLLHILLTNLLDNAWKYSSKTLDPQVEFGYMKQNGKSAYFVRDNGAGFDMAYANKLFGAFQRLHTASEFEGTGIGLATVQRIVHRHTGEIWAEAAVGKGATFYFTLADVGNQ